MSLLKATGITKSFGEFQVLHGIDVEINENEVVGLIGPNGCGKSTTYNCITGFLGTDSGTVELYGKEITNQPTFQINQAGLARTFQNTRLWRELTVIENLMLAPKNQHGSSLLNSLLRRKETIIEESELLEKAYETLDILEITHMANNYASELSGGQSKLVDLARLLMNDPKILLLDEPVAGVAGPLVQKIFDKIMDLKKTKKLSVMIIEHNMEFILRQGIDRVFVMSAGRIVADGTPAQITEMEEVIDAYLGE